MLIIQFDFNFLPKAKQAKSFTIQGEQAEHIYVHAVSNSWTIARETTKVILLSVPGGFPCLVLTSPFKKDVRANGSIPRGK